ncbi:hydrogenase maturation peptidase HycI [Telmatospirillum sp.]|uniref:hydrogenase maturation peptidase HycI n=1 Tax=Telmatospirillum sp. TaxID=2079197 RepID=UPI002849D7E0|nr:hydrogenase maturation peptidase HycI [Telmatospirillum sp.]MDR3438354.1 hydrogenase maturation peptidase HycI [Telmatospirillum sp.]
MSGVIFTVGNTMQGDDGAGPLLAELLEAQPAACWDVVDGEASPENHIHRIRALEPDRVLIVDAADMQLAPGAVRLIDEDCVAQQFLVTTHAIPLNFLIASLRETVAKIDFLGIQPKEIGFLFPMAPEVRLAVEALHQDLVSGIEIESFGLVGGDEPVVT